MAGHVAYSQAGCAYGGSNRVSRSTSLCPQDLWASSLALLLLLFGRPCCETTECLLQESNLSSGQELLQVRCADFPRLPLISWLAGGECRLSHLPLILNCMLGPQMSTTHPIFVESLCFSASSCSQGWCTTLKASWHRPWLVCPAARQIRQRKHKICDFESI